MLNNTAEMPKKVCASVYENIRFFSSHDGKMLQNSFRLFLFIVDIQRSALNVKSQDDTIGFHSCLTGFTINAH